MRSRLTESTDGVKGKLPVLVVFYLDGNGKVLLPHHECGWNCTTIVSFSSGVVIMLLWGSFGIF